MVNFNKMFCDNNVLRFVIISIMVITIFVNTVECTSSSSNSNEAAKRNSIRVCGKKLVNTLKKVCNHCYREPRLIRTADKRGYQPDSWEERRDFFDRVQRLEQLQQENGDGSDRSAVGDIIDRYIDKRFGHNTQVSHSTSGIATKCCINQCGWTDLTAYCCKRPDPLTEN